MPNRARETDPGASTNRPRASGNNHSSSLVPLSMRAQTTIHQSRELIRQTRALAFQTTMLLWQMDRETAWDGIGLRERDAVWRSRDSVLNWVLEAALRVSGAEKGNLQLVDEAGELHIAVERGFGHKFLDFFDCVHRGEAACGTALQRGETVMVEDVTCSSIFQKTPALEVLLDARVRAVQSTPLIGHGGQVVGVLSTHWSSPRRLSAEELLQLTLLANASVGYFAQYDFV